MIKEQIIKILNECKKSGSDYYNGTYIIEKLKTAFKANNFRLFSLESEYNTVHKIFIITIKWWEDDEYKEIAEFWELKESNYEN